LAQAVLASFPKIFASQGGEEKSSLTNTCAPFKKNAVSWRSSLDRWIAALGS